MHFSNFSSRAGFPCKGVEPTSCFVTAGTSVCLDFDFSLLTYSVTHVTADRRGGIVDVVDKIWLSPSNHDWLWKVSLFDGEAQLAVCWREPEGIPLECDIVV